MVYIDEAKAAAAIKAIPSAEIVQWAKIEADTMARAHETRKNAKRRDPNRYPHYEAEWNAECAVMDMRELASTLSMRAANAGLVTGEIIDQLTPGDIFKDSMYGGGNGERWIFDHWVDNNQWGIVRIYYFRRENGKGGQRDIQAPELSRHLYNRSLYFVGKPEPVAPPLPNNTYVIAGGCAGRVVNAANTEADQVFVLLDGAAYAQEFARSEVAIDPRYTPEAIEDYRTAHNAVQVAAEEMLASVDAAITVAEKMADSPSVYIDHAALRACMGTGDTFTASAAERLVLSRFLDYLESNRYAIGEYGKSEGGGSPLTPVDSAAEVVEDFLRPRR